MEKLLIEEARKVAAMWRGAGFEHGVENLLTRLADALENEERNWDVERSASGVGYIKVEGMRK